MLERPTKGQWIKSLGPTYACTTVECYVDDIAVKSRRQTDHLIDLREVFDVMRRHQLKMNPTKSFLGVSTRKFLGFVINSKGISLDPEKVKAIQDMPPPRSLRELRGCRADWPISEGSSLISQGNASLSVN